MKHISQREAHRLRKQVRELEDRLEGLQRTWGREYPGVHLLTLNKTDHIGEEDVAIVNTARRMGHPVVATVIDNAIQFYGVKR